jgi:hypothetical protein
MATLSHWLTIGAAFVAAVVLVLLGKTSLNLADARKRPTLFLAALAFFVATYGAAPAPAREAAEPPNADGVCRRIVELPPELSSPERWAQFQELWDELNAVEPRMEEPPQLPNGAYGRTIPTEKAQALRQRLADCLDVAVEDLPAVMAKTRLGLRGQEAQGIKNVKTLSPAGLALANVALERIDYMERGDTTMMTRMVMPMARTSRYHVLEDLEKRLDTLAVLRESGKIQSEEYATALRGIQNDIYLIAILYVMEGGAGWMYSGPEANPLVVEIAKSPTSQPHPPLTDSEEKLAEVYRRIEALKQMKANGKIKDSEYAAQTSELQREAGGILRLDPDAWIRSVEQALRNIPASQQAGDGVAKDAASHRQTKAALEMLKSARPSIDATVENLEAADRTAATQKAQ